MPIKMNLQLFAGPVSINARLTEIVSAPNIAGYYETMQQDVRPYLGTTLFPAQKIAGLELKSIKGRAGSAVLLKPSAFDANAPIRDRIAFQQITNEMPFFREAMVIGERDRQNLLQAIAAGDSYVKVMLSNIFNDQYHLVLGADAAIERMRMKLLSTGSIKIAENNVPFDYDYGFNASAQVTTLTGNDTWDKPATAKPLHVIQEAMRKARLRSAVVLCTQATFLNIVAAESVKGAMFAQNSIPTFITPGQVQEFMRAALGITFVVIDPLQNAYRDTVGGAEKQMYPDGVVTLIPEGVTLGNTYYGTTPEEADLMTGAAAAQVSIVNTGVAVTTLVKTHPVNVETIVSQIALPSCERIDNIHIINAYTV